MTDSQAPAYHRQARAGKLSFATKLFQAVGAIPDTTLTWVFTTFVLLFYNRILGVDAVLVSAALAVAIIVDGVLDPIVATLSDNLHTRWGRRHPLMLLGAAPLGPVFCAIFLPPAGWPAVGLFVWLTGFVLLTRVCMTLFFVPWSAIAAELSDDYEERTSVMAFRYAVGGSVGVLFPLIVFTFLMPSTRGHPVGQLNAAHYPAMAISAAVLMSGTGLLTTLLTRREIPYMRQHVLRPPRFSAAQTVRELGRAMRNRQFALVFIIVLLSAALDGTLGNIGIFMTTYFWGLTTEDLRWFALAALGGVAAFPMVAWAQRRWDKKHILLACSSVNLSIGIAAVAARFAHLLPPNGDPALLPILVVAASFGAGVALIQGIIGASVIADILDQHELLTGYRQEAMFNAALSFSGKAVSGLGIVLSGLILTLIDLPKHAAPAQIPADKIRLMGWIAGIGLPLFYIVPIWLIRRYRITRQVHADIREELNQRAAAKEGLAA